MANRNNHFFLATNTGVLSDKLASRINDLLALGRPVLWLVSGGSTIKIAVETAGKVKLTQTGNLTVCLVDERFGPIGHPDSNWKQLMDAGFELPGARLEPVLDGLSFEDTILKFENFYQNHLSDYKIALLGMGTDGHTAGILPGSPALNEKRLTGGYEWSDYKRITLSFKGLKQLDEAWLYAVGDNKAPALRALAADGALNEQPAQIIKQIPRWSVYNDLIGD